MPYATARQIELSDMPLIDIAPLVAGDAAGSRAAAVAMAPAARRVGFFYITGHGVDAAVVEAAFAAACDFFALPEAAKREVAVDSGQHGWIGQGGPRMHAGARIDRTESFVCALDGSGADRWPAALPALRTALEPFHRAAIGAGRAVLRGLALSLGRPAAAFDGYFTRPHARLCAAFHPPQPPEPNGHTSAAAHTDHGGLTLLAQDPAGGLQVLGPTGEWLIAHPVPGTLLVNLGDLMQRWTNDRYRSNAHRVVNGSGQARQSLEVFLDPSFDAVVDPRDLLDDPAAARHPPIGCGEYLRGQLERVFPQRPGGAGS